MRHSGGNVGVTETAKNTKSGVDGQQAMETRVRNKRVDGFARTSVDKICCGSERPSPKYFRKMGLKHECAHSIIKGANSTLGLAILL
jgi:hypothetical protein